MKRTTEELKELYACPIWKAYLTKVKNKSCDWPAIESEAQRMDFSPWGWYSMLFGDADNTTDNWGTDEVTKRAAIV